MTVNILADYRWCLFARHLQYSAVTWSVTAGRPTYHLDVSGNAVTARRCAGSGLQHCLLDLVCCDLKPISYARGAGGAASVRANVFVHAVI